MSEDRQEPDRPLKVVVTGIEIPFGDLVCLSIKLAIANIGIALVVVFAVCSLNNP